ncbi:molybdopterin biosynthesis protein [Kordiimonas sediminis]|uniref:Molybdopterin-synthase adenylyltransferase n=1 Tax=Kordiimonas sediminis TaxID=1735581 RepID=A0A919AKG7_9PROT|nr:molybdopterin-synthase adenylyltransferase MoeB [Kordiimonas sediminis]GHF12779.1 molybdopterin biosynthesis protein [Kordiimonas sediminis]
MSLLDFSDEQLERYSRHLVLKEIGGAGQLALLKSKVLVIGAGGLGSPLLMYLAAAGVGTIGIIDDDRVDISNLQRQIIHTTDRIGAAKVDSAEISLSAINPDVRVVKYSDRLTADNAAQIIATYDLVADGCDNFATRLLVSDTCVALGITLVSAALGPFEAHLATFKPHKGDELPCYRCYMPELPGDDQNRTCADTGIIGAVAGVAGSMQALEVVKEITGAGDSLAGKFLIFDALSMRSRLIKLPKDPACPSCGKSVGHV